MSVADLQKWNESYKLALEDLMTFSLLSDSISGAVLRLENISQQITYHSQTIAAYVTHRLWCSGKILPWGTWKRLPFLSFLSS